MKQSTESSDVVIAETAHLRLVDRGGWSFAQRRTCTGVVCIVPVTGAREIVLVEQYRPPLRQSVIELPAGLAGDVAEASDESLADAAGRELFEETGYVAGRMRQLMTLASCPGLTDETITFFIADQLEKQAAGGGDGDEDIELHVVPLDAADQWLATAIAAGKLIDSRVYAGLYFLSKEISAPTFL